MIHMYFLRLRKTCFVSISIIIFVCMKKSLPTTKSIEKLGLKSVHEKKIMLREEKNIVIKQRETKHG